MKTLAVVFCFNERAKIVRTLSRFPANRDYDLLVMDDGSSDGSAEAVRGFSGVTLLSHPSNRGIGSAIKTVCEYALRQGYEIIVHVAGNDKDDPLQIPLLLDPIVKEGFDLVQGSRYLAGGAFGNMPRYRWIATRFVHPMLFSCAARRRITDSTNGFRAYRVSLLKDPRIDIHQDWLNQYELEPYLLFKAIRLGFKVKEVPVAKIYPPHELGYTKMRAFSGWWSILRPLVYLGFGIKR